MTWMHGSSSKVWTFHLLGCLGGGRGWGGTNWPGSQHRHHPSPPGWTFLSSPAAASPGRAVCSSGSLQTWAGHWESGPSPRSNLRDWTPEWSREPEPEEPPPCPGTHVMLGDVFTCLYAGSSFSHVGVHFYWFQVSLFDLIFKEKFRKW